jgi:hypothetical protein
MSDDGRGGRRVTASAMALVALVWIAALKLQMNQPGFDGPPMGALCLALPAIALLLGAAALWSRR